MWHITLETLGTVLKIFTPAAIISWICQHDTFVSKILQRCDRTIKSVLYKQSSEETNDVLRWLQELLPGDERTRSLDDVWANGAVVCDIVESVIPGSCSEHINEGNVDLTHGQRLAERYLGITPVFTNEDLLQRSLSTANECKLFHYLSSIRDAISQLSPPISRAGSPILNVQAYTLDYVARGMGLVTATQNRKATFFIYPTAQQAIEPGDVSIQIKGPYGCYGSALVPAIYGRTHIIRRVFSNMGQPHYYCDPVRRNYHLPKISNDIEVSVDVTNDSVKVAYIPTGFGHHELSLISKGCHIIGSPYRINVEESTEPPVQLMLETEFDPKNSDKKIVFRIVDFVTEKMLLREDGTLEKISNEDAETFMHRIDSVENLALQCLKFNQKIYSDPDLIEYQKPKADKTKQHFNSTVRRVLAILRVCNELRDLAAARKTTPDIVNSTLKEHCLEESSNVSQSASELRKQYKNKLASFNQTNDTDDSLKDFEFKTNDFFTKMPKSIDIVISSFDDEDFDVVAETITIDAVPFERPKTPIFKVLTVDEEEQTKTDFFHGFDIHKYEGQFDSLTREESCDARVDDDNCQKSIDFHIGAPVTPTPTISNGSLEIDMDSIILASNLEEALQKYDVKLQNDSISTPLRQTPFEQMTDSEIIEMYESPIGDVIENRDFDQSFSLDSAEEAEPDNDVTANTTRDNSASSDTWDSAYISIDEINSSPETINSPQNKLFSIVESDSENGSKYNSSLYPEDYSKLGPAERELWESITKNEIAKENNFNFNYNGHLGYRDSIIMKNSISPIGENEVCNENIQINNESDNKDLIDDKSIFVDSASDGVLDVNRTKYDIEEKHEISSIQINPELQDENQNYVSVNKIQRNCKTPTLKLSKTISEKKDFWDEKINHVISNEEKIKAFKRKTKSFIGYDTENKTKIQQRHRSTTCVNSFNYENDNFDKTLMTESNEKLVTKWKEYWDKKLEKADIPDPNKIHFHNELKKNRKYLVSPDEESADEIALYESEIFKDLENFTPNPNPTYNDRNDTNDKQEHENPKIISHLSQRIDEYLDTLSNPSPSTIEIEEFRIFSTPDHDTNLDEKSLLKLEKNDDRLFVTWNSTYNDKRLDILMNMSTPTTPIPSVIDCSGENCKENKNIEFDTDESSSTTKANTYEADNQEKTAIIKLKEKFENISKTSSIDTRPPFGKHKSKTLDFPQVESFKKLQKYFSMDGLNHDVKDNGKEFIDTEFNRIYKHNIENDEVIDLENTVSVESIPTLAEKKARIELHLQSIQNKIKNLPTSASSLPTTDNRNRNISNSDDGNKNLSINDISEESTCISKPISVLVAAFERHCSPTKNQSFNKNSIANITKKNKKHPPIMDAVCPIGTTDTPNENFKLSTMHITNHSEENTKKENEYKNNDKDENCDFIQSDNYKEKFRQTKLFFQNLNEASKQTPKKTFNECEKLLYKSAPKNTKINKSCNDITAHNTDTKKNETVNRNEKYVRTYKKMKRKSLSAPTSDTELEYQRYLRVQGRLVKISEKFHVEDLFKDIAGEQNGGGFDSFRGIPHKKAVLAAFNSIENIDQVNSYKFIDAQLNDEEQDSIFNHIPNSNITKTPSKPDTTTSGLILRKDFLKLERSRRNSAPCGFCMSTELYTNI